MVLFSIRLQLVAGGADNSVAQSSNSILSARPADLLSPQSILGGMRFDGNQSLANVVTMLNRATDFLGGHGRFTVRSVVVRAGNQWFNHVTVMHFGLSDGPISPRDVVPLTDAVLVESQFDGQHEMSVDDLQAMATSWQEAVSLTDRRELQEQTSVHRTFSDSREPDRWPCWECRLSERPPSSGAPYPAPGPYLHVERSLFAHSLSDLTTQWVKLRHWENQTNVMQEYRLLIEDRRGRVVGLELLDEFLSVSVDALDDRPYHCAVRTKSLAGSYHKAIQPVVGETTSFHVEGPADELDVWLMSDDGEVLDRYSEGPAYASWGRENSVYNGSAALDRDWPAVVALIEGGESQRVEFKPYVRLSPPDPKSIELAIAACAFANSLGGSILIGVTNHGLSKGVDGEWLKAYGKDCKHDLECLRNAYARDVRHLLREKLVPEVSLSFTWHQVALHEILEVRVGPSNTLVSLIESGDIFKRVGATSRKMRPDQAIAERRESDALG